MTWCLDGRGRYVTEVEGLELTASRRPRSGWEWYVRSIAAGDAARYVVGCGYKRTLRESKRAAEKAARQGGK